MKAYEFPARVTPDGSLELPDDLADLLPENHVVRVIILVNEPDEEQTAWSQLTAEQFLEGYSEADAIKENTPMTTVAHIFQTLEYDPAIATQEDPDAPTEVEVGFDVMGAR